MAAAACAFALALLITSGYGPGLDPDSMAYVGAATSFARGDGLRVPMGKWESRDSTVALTVWPPAFPAAMAAAQSVGIAPLASARIVNALSAAATAAIVVAIFAGAVTPLTAVVGFIAILATPSFVVVHLNVLSEPLFLAGMLLTLYGMVSRRPKIAAAGAVAAVMTRYAGVAAGAAAAFWFLFLVDGPLRQRIRNATISAAPAALSLLLWIAHNSRVAVVQSPIRLAYHAGLSATLRQGIATVMASLAPGASEWVGILAAGILLIALGVALARPKRHETDAHVGDDSPRIVAAATAILLLSYLGVIVASRMFVGGSIAFDARILAPAVLLGEILVIVIVASPLGRGSIAPRAVSGLLLTIWLIASLRWDGPLVRDSIEDGNDFAASDWRESPMIQWIAGHSMGQTIYTNWPAAIYFNGRRHTFDIPTTLAPDSLQLFGKMVRENRGLFAAFNTRNVDYPVSDSIAAGAGLVQIGKFDDGVVWAGKPDYRLLSNPFER